MELGNRKKTRGVLASVIVISLVVHFAGLVVFGAVKIAQQVLREDVAFEPPPIEPPPQEQPEYTVNLRRQQESSSPPPPVAMVVESPEDITVPTLDIDVNVANTSAYGVGSGGFGSGGGGGKIREMAVDLTALGYSGFVEGTLEGTLFDFKKDSRGKKLVDYDPDAESDNDLGGRMRNLCREFLDGSWSATSLRRDYYAAEQKLYASYLVLPSQDAALAPEVFGAKGEIDPISIAVLYEGSFTPTESGRYRFFGNADDVMVVRVNKRIVFEGTWCTDPDRPVSYYKVTDHDSTQTNVRKFGVNRGAWYGEWMEWTAGKPMDIQIFFAELPGGGFGAWLTVQKEGDRDAKIFSTKGLTAEEKRRLRETHSDADEFL